MNEQYYLTKTYQQVKQTFIKMIRTGNSEDKEGILIPKMYIMQLIKDLQNLLSFIKTKGRAIILGSSLFFTFARDYYEKAEEYDKELHIARVKLIDLCHVEHFNEEEEEQKDEGFILGVQNTIKMLNEIIDENY
eukprot:403345474